MRNRRHPNVIGNARFWSHVERVNEDGSESRVMSQTVRTDHAERILSNVLWSLAWSAGALRNAFTVTREGVETILSKCGGKR